MDFISIVSSLISNVYKHFAMKNFNKIIFFHQENLIVETNKNGKGLIIGTIQLSSAKYQYN